jgi:hypothetical protein
MIGPVSGSYFKHCLAVGINMLQLLLLIREGTVTCFDTARGNFLWHTEL